MGGKGAKGKGKGKSPFKRTMSKVSKIDASCKVYVSDVAQKVTWKDLEKHFEENGYKPLLSEVLRNGVGVAAFRTAEEANAALSAMSGSVLKGKAITCDVWTEKEKKAGK